MRAGSVGQARYEAGCAEVSARNEAGCSLSGRVCRGECGASFQRNMFTSRIFLK